MITKAKAVMGAARKKIDFPSKSAAIQGAGNFIPPIAKSALGIAAAAAIIYLGYKLIKAPQSILNQGGNREEDRDVDKELDRTPEKPTLSPSQASVIANAIFTAMDGYGTDEDGIVNQMKKIKNNADFLLVQQKFGTRTISSGRFNPEPNYKGRLTGALGSELSSYWTKLINKNLTSKGVTYQV